MFVRTCWQPRTVEELYALIDDEPWARLVTAGPAGPLVTNLPLLLDRSYGALGCLVGHIARANEQAAVLATLQTPALAIFEGPHAYISGSWYPSRDTPPTYYYMAVHCYGRVRIQTEQELAESLDGLTRRLESGYPSPWQLTEIPLADVRRRLPAIVGFRIELERIEGKFKLGQDEPRSDALAVANHLAASPDPQHRRLAEAVRRYSLDRPTEKPL